MKFNANPPNNRPYVYRAENPMSFVFPLQKNIWRYVHRSKLDYDSICSNQNVDQYTVLHSGLTVSEFFYIRKKTQGVVMSSSR